MRVVPNTVPWIRLGKKEKLLLKATKSPKNLRFAEFCTLIEHYGLVKRPGKGSHIVYKWDGSPKFSITIQNKDGNAVTYQVKDFLNKLQDHGLLDNGGE